MWVQQEVYWMGEFSNAILLSVSPLFSISAHWRKAIEIANVSTIDSSAERLKGDSAFESAPEESELTVHNGSALKPLSLVVFREQNEVKPGAEGENTSNTEAALPSNAH